MRARLRLFALVVGVALVGCGDDAAAPVPRVLVIGTVYLDGQPYRGATVDVYTRTYTGLIYYGIDITDVDGRYSFDNEVAHGCQVVSLQAHVFNRPLRILEPPNAIYDVPCDVPLERDFSFETVVVNPSSPRTTFPGRREPSRR